MPNTTTNTPASETEAKQEPSVSNPAASDKVESGTRMPQIDDPQGAGGAGGHVPGSDVARPGAEVAIRHSDAPTNLPDMMRLAEQLADSDVLPAHLRRKPANVLAVMFASRALDIPMWTAFQVMHIIEGKVALDATFQRAMVVRAGHKFRVVERSDERAVVEITRHDAEHAERSEFSWSEARAAGLDTKKTWKAYRKAMLVARATTQAIRDICPEVLFGAAYAPEELGMDLDADGTPVAVIPSERVGADVIVRVPEERKKLQESYRLRIDTAATPADLNAVWADAKRDGVLGAPLGEGTVAEAMQARALEIRAADAAEEKLRAAGLDPTAEPGQPQPGTATAGSGNYPNGPEGVVDADVVDEETEGPFGQDAPGEQGELY